MQGRRQGDRGLVSAEHALPTSTGSASLQKVRERDR